VLATAIPNASDVERMAVHRAALADFAPNGRAARAYGELWAELLERLGSVALTAGHGAGAPAAHSEPR